MKNVINYDYLLGQRDALSGLLTDLQREASHRPEEDWAAARWVIDILRERSVLMQTTVHMAKKTQRDEREGQRW